jgi:hypothetical protein
MVRLLRRVVRLGLLAGIGVAALKVVRGRKAPDPWADSWVSTGPPGGTRPSAAPVPAAPKPPAPDMTAAAPPPAAAPKPPAPGGAGTPPPAASPAPPAPGEAEKPDTGKSASSRAAKSTRKGPARKSPTGRAEEPPGERLWVPANEGVCPTTHPVKAKLSSKIFHMPGGRNYKSTKADRCYPDEASAQADGLRPALR